LYITFTEQALGKTIEMNRIELYVAIKYLDNDSLRQLFKECSLDTDKENRKKIIVTEEDKKWLIESIFINLSEQHIGSKYVFSSIENYLLNTMFIISLIKLMKLDMDSIFVKLNSIIAKHGNSISLYQGINSFLGIQYNLFATEIDPKFLVQMLESVIRKIIKREMNMHERHSFTNNGLKNIFGYAKIQQVIFNDEKVVKQLILEISDFNQHVKMEIVSTILLNIYLIGTESIQQIVKDFALSLENNVDIDNGQLDVPNSENDLSRLSEKQMNIGSKIIFEINLYLAGLKDLSHSFIEKIGKFLSKYEDGSYYDSHAHSIIDLIIAIYEERKEEKIENLYKIARKIRENRRRHRL
jgi:hypothetical protein